MAVIYEHDPGINEHRWHSPGASLVVRRPTVRIIYSTLKGHISNEFIAHIVSVSDGVYRDDGPYHIFVDARGATGYDVDTRARILEWSLNNRHEALTYHVALHGPLNIMMMTLLNVRLNGLMRLHHKGRTFEEALEQAIAATADPV